MLDSQLFFCLGNNIRRQKHEGFNSRVLPLLLCFKTMEFRGRFVLVKQQFEFLQPNFIPPFCPGIHSMPFPLPLPPIRSPSCPPPPPSPNVILHDESDDSVVSKEAKRVTIKVVMAIMACMIVAIFVLGFILMIMKRRRDRRLRRSRNIGPIIFGTQEDFLDGDQGPQLDHHIWYINTVGLDQSVIDSISAFKYKKDEALIEGTECSVCLSEFHEDESLRLLPKCSHAFHITCIDTWLRSHKNCPLCRAPIVNANFVGQVGVSDPSSSGSASRVESQIENSEISGLSTEVAVEDGTREVRIGDGSGRELTIEDEIDGGNHSKVNLNNSILRDHSRFQSDLVDNSQAFDAAIQPIRRSVSLDYSSASAIYSAVANAMNGEIQESENHQLQQKNSKSKSAAKRGSGGSMSFRKLMKSSSIGFSLQKGPVSMKRSFSSSSGKCSSSRNSRSQDSILPL